ncbi:enoyl-CoA hydratase-related protein [Terricaulis sp.]|uniref:enoyl-CoA hydratase-related protein n=1 Tax=Terricaulis sp. TaxID=2768686 RepID=UPI003784CB68
MSESGVAHSADTGADDVDGLVAAQTSPLVVVDRGKARIVVFNRPQARNALTRDMRRALAVVLAEADAEESVASLIVTGAGGVFCAGVDIKESRAEPAAMVRPHPGEALRALSKPVIAAVDGPCITGGLEIALSCSFIIATRRARFADTHAKVGVFPAWGMTALLPRAVGVRRARQMMLTAAPIEAATALDWGLVNELVDPPALLARALQLSAAMADLDPHLLSRELALVNRHAAVEDALVAEAEAAARWRAEKG